MSVGSTVRQMFAGDSRGWPFLWMLVGSANALRGVRMAMDPFGSRDLRTLYGWAEIAFVKGQNPYLAAIPCDYPPWALAVVSPLTLVPLWLLPQVWSLFNLALGLLVAWLGCVAVGVARRPPLLLAVGVLFTWAATRIGIANGQVALLAVSSGLAAVCLSRKGSLWSGPLFGLSLIKPHVALAFAAWAVLERRFIVLLGGAITISVATLAVSSRVGETPAAIMLDYSHEVVRQLGASAFARGSTELRPLVHDVFGTPRLAEIVTFGFIGLSFVAMATAVKRAGPSDSTKVSLPLACLWALSSVFHNTYDLVLLWPVWIVLWERSAIRGAGVMPLVLVQSALVIGIPGWWWKLTGEGLQPASGIVSAAAIHFDRALVVALLLFFLRDAWPSGSESISRGPAVRQTKADHAAQASARHAQ